MVKKFELDKTGYRLITNDGKDANQEVPHFHVHILGGNNLGGLI
jgi:diadenosine tetraphosphate (Ap4A) HIT family hydrolase